LRAHSTAKRLTYLSALCFLRAQEITDGLVDLLIHIVHKIDVRAEKRVEAEYLNEFKRVANKEGILYRIMASEQKVLSLFEPHTRTIPRHKGGALVEFGRHVILDEVEGGIVTRYQILEHPTEHGQAIEAVGHHQALFAHPPGLVAGDRGVHSAGTEERLLAAGVKRVAIPAAGELSEERQAIERTRRWKRGYRWRVGIEGRIASLRRDFGWRKSAYHGQDGMERWLGLGVIALAK
jgi:hypothetical protein